MKTRASLILFLLVFLGFSQAQAQPLPPTCDPKFNAALNARAWMGGKRDMESAQSTIVKREQDSILDLSCFEGRIATFAQQNNSLFSDGHQRFVGTNAAYGRLFRQPPLCYGPGCLCVPSLTRCNFVLNPQMPTDSHQPTFMPVAGPNPPGGAYTNQSLDNSYTRLIRTALKIYLNQRNFYTNPLPAPPATVCSSMNSVWLTAKCQDFDKAGWITLQDHTGTDRRPTLPFACNDRGTWVTRYADGNPPAVPRAPAAAPSPVGGLDQTLSYRGSIYPAAGSCGSVPPVPTGLIVEITGSAHEDAVCPGVNCWYNYASGNCGN